ncbi:PNPOx family protein [Nocardiopsis salina]|uniref:hypothetical protein n=1 Tax=Nocardiopsis salina TaxID=245836 RepID=UPI00034A047B|nr:hypothetical protein [Nocardiopsis salina]
MRLNEEASWLRLREHLHGVLCTLHPERGPDPQPVVYAVSEDGHLGIPIDRVKPKASSRLQRERNPESDPRAALLVENWDPDDWSRLWWVRAGLEHVGAPGRPLLEELSDQLQAGFPQYIDKPFHRILVCRIVRLSGWAASDE